MLHRSLAINTRGHLVSAHVGLQSCLTFRVDRNASFAHTVTGDLSAGALAFVNWEQSMRFELSLPGTYCFSSPPFLLDTLPAASRHA